LYVQKTGIAFENIEIHHHYIQATTIVIFCL